MKVYTKKDLHLLRKTWHLIGVLALWSAYQLLPIDQIRWIFLSLMVFSLGTDFIRHRSRRVNRAVLWLMLPFMRRQEIRGRAGTSALLTSVTILAWFADPIVVSMSLLFLGFADPLAGLVGNLFGRHKIFGHKSVEGFMAAWGTCALIAYVYLSYHVDRPLSVPGLWLGVISLGFAGALAELLPIFDLDDNLTMPLISGAAIAGYIWLLG